QSQDVEALRWARSDYLGEAADADSHQLAALALFRLLLFEFRISDLLHRLAQGASIVAAVVLPSQRGLVRELLRLDEVFDSELSRVHSNLVGHQIGHALDRMYSLRNAERAAICNASRRFVGVDAVYFDVSGLEIVRAGANVKEAGGKFGWVRRGVGVAMIGDSLGTGSRQLPGFLAGQLPPDVIIAR